MPKLADSHAHLSSEMTWDQVEDLVLRAKDADVGPIINICTDEKSLMRGLELHERYPWIYNTGSTTPHDVDKEGDAVFPLMEKHAKAGDLVGIGETGLDYYYNHSQPETQKIFLRRYLRLALECQLPVVIHCRDAFPDFFQILDEEYQLQGVHAPGVLHCFTGTLAEARQVLERGWYLSLSGIVTFKKSVELREVAKIVPLNKLLIETDTPYLAPQKWRGKPNEPAYIRATAELIADVKGIELSQLAEATRKNVADLFQVATN